VPAPRKELEARVRELRRRHSILAGLIPKQRRAVEDPARWKVIWTTRRAGKTTGVLVDMVYQGLSNPMSRFCYIALTHGSAEGIAWPILRELDQKYSLNARFQEAKLRCTLPTGSTIQLYGADRPRWAARLYGQKLRGVAIDEAAFFGVDLTELVDDVLRPALSDLRGTCYLMSIPGHLPRGLFYALTKGFDWHKSFSGERPEACTEYQAAPRWSVHRWTTFDNPHMKEQHQAEIDEWRNTHPDPESDPKFLRNYLGAWVQQASELVYRFDPELNGYPGPWGRHPSDRYVLGIDFGWDDATALSMNAYRPNQPDFVELESKRLKHALLSEIADHVNMLLDYYGRGQTTIVADAAHKQLFEEFRRRYDFPIIPAEKAKKFEWIQIYNSELVAGRVRLVDPDPMTNPHAEEMLDLCWLTRPDGTLVEQPGQQNDCSDAALVAFKHGRHYLRGEAEPAGPATAAEVIHRQEEELIRLEEELLDLEKEDSWNDF
jgi:hypothetical protein